MSIFAFCGSQVHLMDRSDWEHANTYASTHPHRHTHTSTSLHPQMQLKRLEEVCIDGLHTKSPKNLSIKYIQQNCSTLTFHQFFYLTWLGVAFSTAQLFTSITQHHRYQCAITISTASVRTVQFGYSMDLFSLYFFLLFAPSPPS